MPVTTVDCRSWTFLLVHFTVLAVSICLMYAMSRDHGSCSSSNVSPLGRNDAKFSASSSVWCNRGPNMERLCKFRNICYNPKFHEFHFILTKDSVLSGLSSLESWKEIDMSAVIGHSAFKLKMSLVSPGNENLQNIKAYFDEPMFILHRFKSDNLMHLIHDDLLPLHATYESVSLFGDNLTAQFSLIYIDNYSTNVMDTWYQSYSKYSPLQLSKFVELQCFSTVYVGLLRNSVWFQYGFGQAQGPHTSPNLNVAQIRRFVKHNLEAWNVPKWEHTDQALKIFKVVIIVRQQTRRILNLKFLSDCVERAYFDVTRDHKFEVIKLDLSEHNMTYILGHVSQAQLMIGMHGAGMILSLFLPPGAALVELFPFAINPDHVSFMKALCSSSNQYPLIYEEWRNNVRQDSRPGPQNDQFMGGISHLPIKAQNTIKEMHEVPPVHCCHDAAYLYYMYQDTLVSGDVIHPITRAINKALSYSDEPAHKGIVFPGSLSYLSCTFMNQGHTLNVTWGDISNETDNKDLWFEITIEHNHHITVREVRDRSIHFYLFDLEFVESVDVWFLPFNKELAGYVKYIKCDPRLK